MTATTLLPDTLSGLIRVSLADLQACEIDDNYDISMNEWHAPADEHNTNCEVCMAGAVMAKTLDMPRDGYYAPTDFRSSAGDITRKLYAINDLRTGAVNFALTTMRKGVPDSMQNIHSLNRSIVEYHCNEELFHRQLNRLADDLEKKGL